MSLRQQTVLALSFGFAVIQVVTAVIFAWLSYQLTEREVRSYLVNEANELVQSQFVLSQGQLTFRNDADGNSVTDRLRKRGISALVIDTNGQALNVFGIYRTFISEGEDARSVAGVREAIEKENGSNGFSHLTLETNEQFETYIFPLSFNGQHVLWMQVAREERSLADLLHSSSLILLGLIPLSILVGIILSLWIVRRALSPLERLIVAVRRIPDGVFPDHIPQTPRESPEYGVLISVINRLLSSYGGVLTRHKEFIGNVAHELRTPLTKAVTGVDVVLRNKTAVSEPAAEGLKSLQNDLLGISTTIDSLLSLSRLYEADRNNATTTHISHVVSRVLKEREDEIQKKHLAVVREIPDDDVFPMPPPLTRALLGNIIENAIKYSNASSGTITITMTRTQNTVVVRVSDTGIGMPEYVLTHMFDRRFRGTHDFSGHGVGMALVKRIADMWHADISVASKEGHGTTVTITMKR